jgi:hypothetical protein
VNVHRTVPQYGVESSASQELDEPRELVPGGKKALEK